MSGRVILVHGIHTAAGSPVVQRLIPYLEAEGFEVVYPDYGYEFAAETKFVNPMLVGTILPFIQPGDLFVGHSNGCAIGYELMKLGAPITGAAFINAALASNIVLPPQVKFLDVYYNIGDLVTEAAKIGQELGLLDPAWGEMGHSGYTGHDEHVWGHDCAVQPAPCFGHSAMFIPEPQLAYWGPVVAKNLSAGGNGSKKIH